IDPANAARRLMGELDTNQDGKLSAEEVARGLLPEDFSIIDKEGRGYVTESQLAATLNHVADQLPNLASPELNGAGALEIFVTVAHRLCDFLSAIATARVPEWNCWYHIMNCGFPPKVSGETDFPCMSGTRVGQGRVYVQLGKVDHVDFSAWCEGLARGQ